MPLLIPECEFTLPFDPFALQQIGSTDLHVTRLGFGGAPLADRSQVTPNAQSDATLEAAYAAGIRFFDTSPWYGNGKSEHRLGHVLQEKPRDSFVLTTKVGRLFFRPADFEALRPRLRGNEYAFDYRFDYTREAVLRSYQDSLQRLGMPVVDALLIHDLDRYSCPTDEALAARFGELEAGGGYAALQELKARGEIKAVGAGINHAGMIPLFLERFDLDFFLVAMPYTLLNQDSLEVDLRLCAERGVSVVIGAVFSSGILAGGPTYGYQAPQPEIVEKVQRVRAVCERHEVPVGAAALQFPLAHPSVVSVIPGAVSPEQVHQNIEWLQREIPGEFWSELKAEGLLHPEAPTP